MVLTNEESVGVDDEVVVDCGPEPISLAAAVPDKVPARLETCVNNPFHPGTPSDVQAIVKGLVLNWSDVCMYLNIDPELIKAYVVHPERGQYTYCELFVKYISDEGEHCVSLYALLMAMRQAKISRVMCELFPEGARSVFPELFGGASSSGNFGVARSAPLTKMAAAAAVVAPPRLFVSHKFATIGDGIWRPSIKEKGDFARTIAPAWKYVAEHLDKEPSYIEGRLPSGSSAEDCAYSLVGLITSKGHPRILLAQILYECPTLDLSAAAKRFFPEQF